MFLSFFSLYKATVDQCVGLGSILSDYKAVLSLPDACISMHGPSAVGKLLMASAVRLPAILLMFWMQEQHYQLQQHRITTIFRRMTRFSLTHSPIGCNRHIVTSITMHHYLVLYYS